MNFIYFGVGLYGFIYLVLVLIYWLKRLFVRNRPSTYKEDVDDAATVWTILILFAGIVLFLLGGIALVVAMLLH